MRRGSRWAALAAALLLLPGAGSGLGLALTREVVRLHGGDVTLQSQLDKGSTFTMTLPVHDRAA